MGKRPYKAKAMKRIGNLFHQICSIENLECADKKARKGKGSQHGIKRHDLNRHENIARLREMLLNKTYRTSRYNTFKIYEPKERLVYKLPYFPDRITHHAIMNVLEPVFRSMFTADTYSCIKGKGIHLAADNLREVLKDIPGTTYYLKLDIKKFYPSIDHRILKQLLGRKFKDQDLLWILDEIIDSATGLPIGNYISQHFANFYLTYFDHWIKEVKGVKYYFRYADDIVILSHSKTDLHKLRFEIQHYLHEHLNLSIKSNYCVAPVDTGIDFLGYVFRHTHTRLRPSIKRRFIQMTRYRKNPASIASYNGWIIHCDGKHLWKTYLRQAV